MRTIILILFAIILLITVLYYIYKIIGNIPHIFDFKQNQTHDNEEE